jgi:uncharacterized protein (DUF1800 family)
VGSRVVFLAVAGAARRQAPGAGLILALLAACGGGSPSGRNEAASETIPTCAPSAVPQAAATHGEAFRLLTQATFGPTEAEVAEVMASGVEAWIDKQLALPAAPGYLARWDADTNGGVAPVTSQFYKQALTRPDQLRGRVAYALSQIFVVSTQELTNARSRAAASYFDMLDRDAFGDYRALLRDVSMHPAMGQYLSSLRNVKENPLTGQIPDQNFAREVMQLMSIGLTRLEADGSQRLDASGRPIDTYDGDDVVGLSKVFTGFSWYGPDTSDLRFFGDAGTQDPQRMVRPMQAYPQFHSTSEKRFLGATIAPQGTPDAAADLETALDTLSLHPNVGPFIGRQLIQRLVTSHPAPAYVARVAKVFADNGQGVRGDLKAVVRAILLDPEARDGAIAAGDAYGKIREPVLRLTAWMRAFGATSASGRVLITNTDDPGLELGQTPLGAGSVFNFYRPGFVAAGTGTGARGLTVPELQITTEASVAGYVNYMSTVVSKGVGQRVARRDSASPDVQPDYGRELEAAPSSAALTGCVALKLLGDGGSAALEAEIRAAVDAIAMPPSGASRAEVTAARRNRVWSAVLLTLASPEFIVQK